MSKELIQDEDVRILTPFAVSVSGPGVEGVEQCGKQIYTYTVTNTGLNEDTYDVTAVGFGDPSVVELDEPLVLAGGASKTFSVEITVPGDAPAGTDGTTTVTVESRHSQDTAETVTRVLEDEDGDRDGVGVCDDECPGSNVDPVLVIGNCDTGVENKVLPGGCTFADLIEHCAGGRNHGQRVSCVTHLTNEWRKAGLIDKDERKRILDCVKHKQRK